MLLERFGLWEARHERVSTFSRGMQQRLGLCRVLLHDPQLLLLDEPYNALDAEGAALLDATLDERAGRGSSRRTSRSASSDVRRSGSRSRELRRRRRRAGAQGPAARAAREGDAAVDAAVRDLGADDLPLRAAARHRPPGRARAALVGADLHRAPRPDPRVRRRARAGDDRRARARAVRPQRDLARQVARGARVPRRRRGGRAARPSRSSSPASTVAPSLRSRSPTSGSAPSGRSSARWRSPAARASCSCRCSSCRSRSRSSSAGRAATSWFLVALRRVFALLAWALVRVRRLRDVSARHYHGPVRRTLAANRVAAVAGLAAVL